MSLKAKRKVVSSIPLMDGGTALRKMQDLESEDLKDYFAGLRSKLN